MSNRIIIDILAPKIEQSPYFVVDNTIMQVPVIAGDANPVPLINAIGDSVFQIGDTCQILSCGFVLPHSFTLGQTGSGYPFWTHQFYFARDPAWNTPIGLEHMANNTNGQLGVFLENYEMFIDIPHNIIFNNATQRHEFQFQLQLPPGQEPQISMANVPDVFSDEQIKISPFIKVIHNLPMEQR